MLSLTVLWTVAAGAARAETGKRVHNGMQILFSPSTPSAFCTIGAVGNDKYGHRIAISAGHCLNDPGGTYADREIPDDVAPVYDRADPSSARSDTCATSRTPRDRRPVT
ncbi:S1 family peptidase [Streptomyces tricolor]|nr:S1 family peptidase [Streptomyces tricolor]